MARSQPTRTENELESQAATSDASIKSRPVAVSEAAVLPNSAKNTTATTRKGSRKTASKTELQDKISLVAGALADYIAAGGSVVRQNKSGRLPSGSKIMYIKLLIAAPSGYSVTSQTGSDGVEFVISDC